jgi:hypothetical protein
LHRTRSNAATIVFFAAVLGGIVAWALGLSPRLLAIALLFGGALLLLSAGLHVVRGLVLSGTVLYTAIGLVEVACAAALLHLHPVDVWSLGLALVTLGVVFARQIQLALHERRAEAT